MLTIQSNSQTQKIYFRDCYKSSKTKQKKVNIEILTIKTKSIVFSKSLRDCNYIKKDSKSQSLTIREQTHQLTARLNEENGQVCQSCNINHLEKHMYDNHTIPALDLKCHTQQEPKLVHLKPRKQHKDGGTHSDKKHTLKD